MISIQSNLRLRWIECLLLLLLLLVGVSRRNSFTQAKLIASPSHIHQLQHQYQHDRSVRYERHQRGLIEEEARKAIPKIENIQVDLQQKLSLTVTPSQLVGEAEVVTVTWSNVPSPEQYDWIAAYSPIPPTKDAFLQTLPVKFMNLTQSVSTNGSIEMWLLHMREPWIFAYMRGGYDNPTIIGLSEPVYYVNKPEQYNMPMQIHLIRTVESSEMIIVWVTKNESDPIVLYASSLDLLSTNPISVSANTSTYTRGDMCGDLAGSIGWRDPGSIHKATLTDLIPGQQYFYIITGADATSTVQSFYAPPQLGDDIDFIIFGDLGQAEFDGSIEWSEWTHNQSGEEVANPDQPPAINTTKSVRMDFADGTISNVTGITLIIGDVSYARGREAMWDQFHYLIQPFAANAPLMTLLGNHELNWAESYWSGGDSGGECGVAHLARFPMPTPPSSFIQPRPSLKKISQGFDVTPYYSFHHGSVHFIMMSTEHDFSRTSEQFAWIAADLAKVDRNVTPWIVMAGHRPMYVSSADATSPRSDMVIAKFMREELEDLLHQYQVDVFFAGHHHDYQRTCPVYNGTCIYEASPVDEFDISASSSSSSSSSNFGTVHILTGASGQWNNVGLSNITFDWLEFGEDFYHGYNRVRVRGDTLTIEFVASHNRAIIDSVTIRKNQGRANRSINKLQQDKKDKEEVVKAIELDPTELTIFDI